MIAYLDNNATTKCLPEVVSAMGFYLDRWYGNPSSLHQMGLESRKAVEQVRLSIANLINSRNAASVYFTSCATESIHMAFNCAHHALADKNYQIITTKADHVAVLSAAEYFSSKGAELVLLDVDKTGDLDLEQLRRVISQRPSFVSLMAANNETGAILSLKKAAEICRDNNALFHVDAVQAIGKLQIDCGELQCHFLSISAHKFHGPKGVGALYMSPKAPKCPFIFGHQENGLRGGTENVAGIVGMGVAAEYAGKKLESVVTQVSELRNLLEKGLLQSVKNCEINGNPSNRICNTSNIFFPNKNSAELIERLSARGIFASAGAACTNGGEPSHVIEAMGYSRERSNSSIRFSLSQFTTKQEIDYALEIIPEVVDSAMNVYSAV